MIYSMTGFGQAKLKTPQGFIRVEIKTINSKFSELIVKSPGYIGEFEDLIRKTILDELKRGKITVFVSCPESLVYQSKLVLNESLALSVYENILKLRKILKENTLEKSDQKLWRDVLRYPDVLTKDSEKRSGDKLAAQILKALNVALADLKQSRLAEGKALEKDLKGRLSEIEKSVSQIKKRLPALHKEYKKTLESRMKEFIKDEQLDKERLTQEVASYVKNSDISEEITRLLAHVVAVRKFFSQQGEIGKKIDFVGQEMQREANTMGSKSQDTFIAEQVIHIKSTIDKIREQASNVE